MNAGWSLIGLAGLALAAAQPAAAQGAPGGGGLADLPVTAMQNGRTVASTRTDARGGFQLELAPGPYELCVGSTGGVAPNQTRSRTLPDHGPPVPGNGGRAGGQAMGGAGAAGTGCFPYTAVLPEAQGTLRSEPIPVYIRQPDGTILVGLLAGMRTNSGGDSGPVDAPDRAATPGGPSGPVRQLPPLPAQAATNGGGRRVDPLIPPPAGLRISADMGTLRASTEFVTVVGTLSLER